MIGFNTNCFLRAFLVISLVATNVAALEDHFINELMVQNNSKLQNQTNVPSYAIEGGSQKLSVASDAAVGSSVSSAASAGPATSEQSVPQDTSAPQDQDQPQSPSVNPDPELGGPEGYPPYDLDQSWLERIKAKLPEANKQNIGIAVAVVAATGVTIFLVKKYLDKKKKEKVGNGQLAPKQTWAAYLKSKLPKLSRRNVGIAVVSVAAAAILGKLGINWYKSLDATIEQNPGDKTFMFKDGRLLHVRAADIEKFLKSDEYKNLM